MPCATEDVEEFISRPTPEVAAALAQADGPVMVLGAGGKLGLHLTLMAHQALRSLKRSNPVIAVSRYNTLRARADFERLGLTTLSCDLEDPDQLLRLPDAGTVFFLAGVKFGTAMAPDLLRRLNVEMPRRVAERYRSSRIVAFSSGAVYPFVLPASGGASESTPPAPVGDYAASCLAREQSFTEISLRHRTPVALIRLNYAVEFRYGVLVDIAQKVLNGEPLDVSMGYVNVICQGDAVADSVQALSLTATPPAPINVTGPGVLSVRELAERFGREFGRPPKIVGKEAETALLSDASYCHRLFGKPRVSLDQMISWTAAWLVRSGQTWGKPTGFERRNGEY